MHCKAMQLAKEGMISVIALQAIIKILIVGGKPTDEEWEAAKQAVDQFLSTSMSVRSAAELGYSPHETLSRLDVN